MKGLGLIFGLIFLGLTGCVNTRMAGGKTEGTLKASWYGEEFHGRPTASGEIYNMYKKTAAHRSLPFGTRLRVRNISNQRVTIVKVNDRGPFVKGRDLDLSYAAAKELDMMSQGVAEVDVVNLGREGDNQKPTPVAKPVAQEKSAPQAAPVTQTVPVTIQVASFRDPANAANLKEELALNYSPVFIDKDAQQSLYRVKVGQFSTRQEAEPIAQKLTEEGYSAWIVSQL